MVAPNKKLRRKKDANEVMFKTGEWSDHDWVVVSNIFNFQPYLGKIPILTNIFQRGWNHQLDEHSSFIEYILSIAEASRIIVVALVGFSTLYMYLEPKLTPVLNGVKGLLLEGSFPQKIEDIHRFQVVRVTIEVRSSRWLLGFCLTKYHNNRL